MPARARPKFPWVENSLMRHGTRQFSGFLHSVLFSLRGSAFGPLKVFVSPPTGLGFISSVTHPSGFAALASGWANLSARLRRWVSQFLAFSEVQ